MKYLEITTKDTRYVYPTGRIRGLEKYLLTAADLARIKEGKDLEESFQNLSRFYRYSESMRVCADPADFERGLEEEWKRTYVELRSFAPEPELIDLFWLEQDFHNMKVFFKLHAQGQNSQEIDKIEHLSTSGTQNLDMLGSAIIKRDLLSLSPFFREIVQEGMDMIEKGTSARAIDLFLDRRYLQKFVAEMVTYQDDFLTDLAYMIVDSLNVKSALRIKLWSREDEKKLLEDSIIDGGTIEKDMITARAGEPPDSLLEIVRGTEYVRILQKALEEWGEKGSLFTLDASLEEGILSFTSRGLYITFGREPLVNYVLLKKSEVTKLRSILRAKKAHFSHSQIEGMGL